MVVAFANRASRPNAQVDIHIIASSFLSIFSVLLGQFDGICVDHAESDIRIVFEVLVFARIRV